VLEHLEPSDLPAVMKDTRRVLCPEGTLVVGMPGLNSMMTLGFRLLGCDITKHHFSHPRQALEAAFSAFTIDKLMRQPFRSSDSLTAYVWFRGKKR
jgi:predicted SAM-dependent methyltransferase